MAASVLHFGMDECNRILVLRGIGYSVDVCLTLKEFRSTLEQKGDAVAVLVSEKPSIERSEVVTLTRSRSHAPLILFSNGYSEDGRDFDLVIPPLLHPGEWLEKIAAVIEQSRILHASSQMIREISARTRQNSESLRQQSVILRERSAEQRAMAERLMSHLPKITDPSR